MLEDEIKKFFHLTTQSIKASILIQRAKLFRQERQQAITLAEILLEIH
jgi:hypothetical protein